MLLRIDRLIFAEACFVSGHVVSLFHDPEFAGAEFRDTFAEFVAKVRVSGRFRIAFLNDYPLQKPSPSLAMRINKKPRRP